MTRVRSRRCYAGDLAHPGRAGRRTATCTCCRTGPAAYRTPAGCSQQLGGRRAARTSSSSAPRRRSDEVTRRWPARLDAAVRRPSSVVLVAECRRSRRGRRRCGPASAIVFAAGRRRAGTPRGHRPGGRRPAFAGGQRHARSRACVRPSRQPVRHSGRVITVASPEGRGRARRPCPPTWPSGLAACGAAVDRAGRPGRAVRRLRHRARAWRRSTRCPTSVHGPASQDTHGAQDLPHPAPQRAVRRLRSGVARRRGHASPASDVTPAARRAGQGALPATSSSTPRQDSPTQTLAALDRATDVVLLTSMDVARGPRACARSSTCSRELCN